MVSGLCRKLADRMKAMGMRWSALPGEFAVYAPDYTLTLKLREFLSSRLELLSELAELKGIKWDDEDAGDISSPEEISEYMRIVMPVYPEDLRARDYWRERQAMRFADRLPDDFHSTYTACMKQEAL